MRYDFSDFEWSVIRPLLPNKPRGVKRVDDRRVISGIIHVLKSGGRWPDAPRDQYGPHKTLYNRFVCWAEKGVWAARRAPGKDVSRNYPDLSLGNFAIDQRSDRGADTGAQKPRSLL